MCTIICYNCNLEIEYSLSENDDKVEIIDSGESPGYDFTPVIYWVEYFVKCPNCLSKIFCSSS